MVPEPKFTAFNALALGGLFAASAWRRNRKAHQK